MASRTYSTQFIQRAAVTGPATLVYEVPLGFLAVVKCITIVWGDITVSGLDAWVQAANLAKLARYSWTATLAQPTNIGGTALFWGAWACEPLDTLSVQTAAGTCDITASGYLLSLP